MKKFASTLLCFWDKSSDQYFGPELKGRFICVKSQMDTFNYFYGVTILEL